MDKIKITLPKNEINKIDFCGVEIEIQNYLGLDRYDIILADIKNNILYNQDIEDKYAVMHARYVVDILDLCTNIDIESLESEDLFSYHIRELLSNNIKDFDLFESYIDKEYEKMIMENCFGIVANKMPSSKDMEKSVESIKKMVEDLPEDKLNLIAKSIAWNNSPALGNIMAPVEHEVMAGA